MERPKRENAGNRMAVLLEKEDEDDFYKNVYGGFKDEENDIEFESGMEDSTDISDSDISISEDDASYDSSEMLEKEEKLSKISMVKAAMKKSTSLFEKKLVKPKDLEKNEIEESASSLSSERMEVRLSTLIKSETTKQNHIKTIERSQKIKEKRADSYNHFNETMSQAQLLEQAKKMELINLKSLETYQNKEAELKKKARSFKKRHQLENFIRFLSTSRHKIQNNLIPDPTIEMDIETYISRDEKNPINNIDLDKNLPSNDIPTSQNFLVFSDEKSYESYFSLNNANQTKSIDRDHEKICEITGKVAKYTDPLTKKPYYDVEAFKKLRLLYREK
ncbi:unnamed protein product [Gordionus sp. m RMFG-2023]